MTHNSHESKDFKDSKDSKDTSATRILLIIREICNGKDINTLSLNDFDFNVSKRTFQRDIKKVKDFFIEHFAYIPIATMRGFASSHTSGGGNPLYLDKNESRLDSKDSLESTTNPHNLTITLSTQKSIASYIKKFATLSGIKSLYPTLDEDFLYELLDDNINGIYDITQSNYEKINAELFHQISDAILNNEILSFDYKEKQRIVKPYKLSHIKGIWYLIADEDNKLKHFSFTKIQNIVFLPKRFYPKRAFLKQISDNQNLWLSSNPKSALIIINIKAKGYFLRKSLPKNISLIGYDDRKILIRFAYAFDDEVFNFLKVWIPYAQIKEPKELQMRFNAMLEDYVGEVREKMKIGLDSAKAEIQREVRESSDSANESNGESNSDSGELKGESNDSAHESKGESNSDSGESKGESNGDSNESKPNQRDSKSESKADSSDSSESTHESK